MKILTKTIQKIGKWLDRSDTVRVDISEKDFHRLRKQLWRCPYASAGDEIVISGPGDSSELIFELRQNEND